ncbi:hypothetical protein PHMEG_00018094 [Phytophthora megakarya]|uniref:Uncharacterized protein n=1 Tax=Phytophthora megakarya TaxID=4795 RepID=A0A225VUX8_9STRA|nr:hypothetical protein PHMEG_00018094 [Phytophthora megakarya]
MSSPSMNFTTLPRESEIIAAKNNLLREEVRLSVAPRKLGSHTPSNSHSRSGALNTTDKSALSAFVRERQLGLAETVRIYRNETSQDSRPNKALDPSRLKVLLKGYPHLSVLLDIARHGISPVWYNSNRQTSVHPTITFLLLTTKRQLYGALARAKPAVTSVLWMLALWICGRTCTAVRLEQ